MKRMLFVLALALLVIGCTNYDVNDLTQRDIVKVSKFDRIFYHEGSCFSVAIEDANTHQLSFEYLWYPVTIVIDSTKGNCFIEYQRTWRCGFKSTQKTEVFIKSINQIEGGGWNHGKYGQGTTFPLN